MVARSLKQSNVIPFKSVPFHYINQIAFTWVKTLLKRVIRQTQILEMVVNCTIRGVRFKTDTVSYSIKFYTPQNNSKV